jgi:hypothetical protein
MLILGVVLAWLSGCATTRGRLTGAKSAPTSGTEQFGAEMARDPLYDATMPPRGKPSAYEQSIFAP